MMTMMYALLTCNTETTKFNDTKMPARQNVLERPKYSVRVHQHANVASTPILYVERMAKPTTIHVWLNAITLISNAKKCVLAIRGPAGRIMAGRIRVDIRSPVGRTWKIPFIAKKVGNKS